MGGKKKKYFNFQPPFGGGFLLSTIRKKDEY